MTNRLSGPQKAAILLLSLGEEAASDVIKNLSEEEVQLITPHLSNFEDVTPNEVERVTNEFYLIAEKGKFLPAAPETKTNFLKKILSKALGAKKGTNLIEGMLNKDVSSSLEKLKWHDPTTIAEFLSGEHPQVIAVILAYLGDPNLTKNVLDEFPEGVREDLLVRLMRLKEISPEWVEEIEKSFSTEMYAEEEEPEEKKAASDKVAGMLNAAPQGMETSIMSHIEQMDQGLADRIREQMFPIDDFIKLDNYSMQKVLEKATNEDLVLVLRTAEEPLRRHFFRNLSTENARELKEAIESFGPIRISDIESAQKRLSNIARDLAAKGELHLLERKKK